MFVLLLVVGILVTAVGALAVGFGIPNNGFDIGNTLIIAGTTAIGSGVVTIGLAVCVRELRRVSVALRASAARPARGIEDEIADLHAASAAAAPSPRMAYPATPAVEASRTFDARLAAMKEPTPIEEPPAVERARPNVFPMPRPPVEPPADVEPERIPFAPVRGQGAPIGRTPVQPPPPPAMPAAAPLAPTGESPYEPKFGPADILARLGGKGRGNAEPARPLPMSDRGQERPPVEPEAVPPVGREPSRPPFETLWPTAPKLPGRAAAPDAMPRVPKPEPTPEPRSGRYDEAMSDDFDDDDDDEMAAPQTPAVSILKSGIIDGMAYTLYTDGSIEAQLPRGTMRFSSIEELRTHLERHE